MERICSVKIRMDAKIILDRIRANLSRKGLKLTNQQVMEVALEYSSEHMDELIDHIMSEEEEMKKILANPRHWGADTSLMIEKDK